MFLLLPSLVFLIAISATQAAVCTIDIAKLAKPRPIVVEAYTLQFIYPSASFAYDTSTHLQSSEMLFIGCPDGGHLNLGWSPPAIYAVCNSEGQLVSGDTEIDFASLRCDRDYDSVVRIPGIACADRPRHEILEVGFYIESTAFVTLVDVCFDWERQNALYTSFKLPRNIHYALVPTVPGKIMDPYFYTLPRPLQEIYDANSTQTTINSLLGLSVDNNLSGKGIHLEYFVKFYEQFYEKSQAAVVRDILTWPQWKFCHASDFLYTILMDYAAMKEVDLEIYTGLAGVATLPHNQTGAAVELYLYHEEISNVKAIPVPVLLWRLAYDPRTRQAIVLATIDNQELLNAQDFIFCEDISEEVLWLNGNVGCGISYTCSYEDFRNAVPYLPELPVSGLLA